MKAGKTRLAKTQMEMESIYHTIPLRDCEFLTYFFVNHETNSFRALLPPLLSTPLTALVIGLYGWWLWYWRYGYSRIKIVSQGLLCVFVQGRNYQRIDSSSCRIKIVSFKGYYKGELVQGRNR
jgi:hypothetical protein